MLIGFASICACVIVLACLSLGAFFFDMLHQVTINYNTELLGNSRALIDQMLVTSTATCSSSASIRQL